MPRSYPIGISPDTPVVGGIGWTLANDDRIEAVRNAGHSSTAVFAGGGPAILKDCQSVDTRKRTRPECWYCWHALIRPRCGNGQVVRRP